MHPLTEWILSNSSVVLGLALLALLVSRIFRSPALTHVLWLLVLIKLITPPIFRLPVEVSQEVVVSPNGLVNSLVDENLINTFQLERSEQVLKASSVSPLQILLGLWALGSVSSLLIAGYRSWRFNRQLRIASGANEELQRSVQTNAKRLHLKTLPKIVCVEGKLSPLLWAFGRRATIVIPSVLWRDLSEEEQDTLMTHELAHYCRKDHWYRWVEWLILTIFWWHPLVWLARLGLRKAEEDSCDAWVLWALPQSAKDYASAILKTLEFLSGRPMAMPATVCGFAEGRSFKNIKERFTTILKHKPSHAMNKKQKTFSIALAILVLPLSGYLLQTPVVAK